MPLIENYILALKATWAPKLRSALTLLGVIVGVIAVIVIAYLIEVRWRISTMGC